MSLLLLPVIPPPTTPPPPGTLSTAPAPKLDVWNPLFRGVRGVDVINSSFSSRDELFYNFIIAIQLLPLVNSWFYGVFKNF